MQQSSIFIILEQKGFESLVNTTVANLQTIPVPAYFYTTSWPAGKATRLKARSLLNNSNCTSVNWYVMKHAFAPICTHLHICSMQNTQKQINKHSKHIYIWPIYMFSRLHICIYALHICIYGNIYPCAQSAQHIYIYIYIYIYICTAQDPK